MARFPPAGTVVTEDEGPRAPGAVLTGDEILELSADPVPRWHRLIQGIEEDNLKGAAYDLRMADDGTRSQVFALVSRGWPRRRVGPREPCA